MPCLAPYACVPKPWDTAGSLANLRTSLRMPMAHGQEVHKGRDTCRSLPSGVRSHVLQDFCALLLPRDKEGYYRMTDVFLCVMRCADHASASILTDKCVFSQTRLLILPSTKFVLPDTLFRGLHTEAHQSSRLCWLAPHFSRISLESDSTSRASCRPSLWPVSWPSDALPARRHYCMRRQTHLLVALLL